MLPTKLTPPTASPIIKFIEQKHYLSILINRFHHHITDPLLCRNGPAANLINVAFGVSTPSPLRIVRPALESDAGYADERPQFFNERLDDSQKEAVTFAIQNH